MALLPASWVYRSLVSLRRGCYRLGLKRTANLSVPVIVVGNITVGGTGKTPLVLWLAQFLREKGYHPGIVSRGYGGGSTVQPVRVQPHSDPAQLGDEPVLIARKSSCPVVVSRRRAAAVEMLVREYKCDVVVSDDGLQHYAMAHDVEIVVIDGTRRFGNGRCLPAGPLREPIGRLRRVHARVTNGKPGPGEFGMFLAEVCFRGVAQPELRKAAGAFYGQRVHAVAGIGHPKRFFDHLRALGVHVIEHAFPDHYHFQARDIQFDDNSVVIMTEKDAVKCKHFVNGRYWYLVVEARPEPAFGTFVLNLLEEKLRGQKAA
ncbi:MAG: tetraacyldisaccharide 4'-kinase [Acidiferrobacterales bacterium]